MVWMAESWVQDVAELSIEYGEERLFQDDDFFNHPGWEPFRKEVVDEVKKEETEVAKKIQDVVPEVSVGNLAWPHLNYHNCDRYATIISRISRICCTCIIGMQLAYHSYHWYATLVSQIYCSYIWRYTTLIDINTSVCVCLQIADELRITNQQMQGLIVTNSSLVAENRELHGKVEMYMQTIEQLGQQLAALQLATAPQPPARARQSNTQVQQQQQQRQQQQQTQQQQPAQLMRNPAQRNPAQRSRQALYSYGRPDVDGAMPAAPAVRLPNQTMQVWYETCLVFMLQQH